MVSGVIGTTLEWFDFLLYGLIGPAVFDRLFFPHWSKEGGALAVLMVFGAAYAGRPLGGFVFGHFGDRIGRKPMLYLSLILMGVSTSLLGLIPNYAAIGNAAPILLLALRTLQGFALGGEVTGATLLAAEAGPAGKRGGFTALIQIGGALGSVAAAFAATAVARLPEPAMLAWGWRLPFLLSSVLVIVGLYVRSRIAESQVFSQAIAERPRERVPLLGVLRHQLKPALVICLTAMASGSMLNIFSVFGLVYGVGQLGVSRAALLDGVVFGNIVAAVANPLYGRLSDLVGRKPVIVTGIVASVLYAAFVFFPVLATRDALLITIAATIPPALIQPMIFSTGASYYAELVTDTRVRFTAIGVANSAGSVIAGFFPAVAAALLSSVGSIRGPVAYYASTSLVAVTAILLTRETRARPL